MDFKKQLLSTLEQITGSGSFVSNNVQPFLFPGLDIQGIGEIAFPVNTAQVNEMIQAAHKAPFGKGSATVLDTRVRSVWEIDAAEIAFKNKDWGKFITHILDRVKADLGIEGHSITANLYKLLIYEQGDFFVTHKDSEKENGMFGTLIVGLPSKHTGGELSVKFDGKEECVDFSKPASEYQIPFAAFYADCEHEIKPITSGHRVCLVYNLVQNKGKEKIELQPLEDYIEKLFGILKANEGDFDIPKIVLLGHQYTPANFTMEALKLNDRPKAEALIQAAQKAEYYCKLGLVTSYQMGELEVSSSRSRRGYYSDYYDDEDIENGTMGEVYDEDVRIEHWMEEGIPPLRNLQFDEKYLISAITMNEGEPDEKDAEGYTGNAGMEMTYWYHYAAVFLWPKKRHFEVLSSLEPDNKLEWIDYYNKNWATLGPDDHKVIKQLVESGLHINTGRTKSDFSPLVDWLVNIKDQEYVTEKAGAFLLDNFKLIKVEGWVKLFETYPYSCFEQVFVKAAGLYKTTILKHQLIILNSLLEKNTDLYRPFVLLQLDQIPDALNLTILTDNGERSRVKVILQNMLSLSKLMIQDMAWLNNTTSAFTKQLTRDYVNDVLVAGVLEFNEKIPLVTQIITVCQQDLTLRVNDKPQPPADWSRSVPVTSGGYGKVWDILSEFIQSPTQQVFNYQALQAYRQTMESEVRSVTIDLRLETIKKGSPHTLRLTKTQDAYERELAKWKIDVGLLEKAEKF
jgi:hypothetical protein